MKIKELKAGLDNVEVIVRVISAREPIIIETKAGAKKIQEAVVGDETGRVKLTLWGELAGKVKKGEVYRITNAWTTAYRGRVILNAGNKSKIVQMDDNALPRIELIPDIFPFAGEYRLPLRKKA